MGKTVLGRFGNRHLDRFFEQTLPVEEADICPQVFDDVVDAFFGALASRRAL